MTRELTGRKVFFIALGAFGVIVAANIALAVAAVGTFPGLEVRNGYVASQSFEAERAAQARLGWRAEAEYADGRLRIAILDRAGAHAPIEDIAVKIGRPTGEAVDRSAQFTRGEAEIDLAPGLWRVDIVATDRAGARFRQHLTIEVGA